ncbi:MAG: hypothetical protein HC819_21005 [Cyclobacteriaceae bacterium]|nr:hypothetical protein [Cyclobacteriaceae bacterium]
MVRVHAINSLEAVGGEVARAAVGKARELVSRQDAPTYERGYDVRAANHLIEMYE